MTDWEIKNGVWTEVPVSGLGSVPVKTEGAIMPKETDVIAAFEKAEGNKIPVVSPACSVPYSTPSSDWWEGLELIDSAEEMLADMERLTKEHTYPKISNKSYCPTGAFFKTYAVAIEASRELVEDGYINGEEIEGLAEKYLVRSLVKRVLKEYHENAGLLYWRVKPEVNRQQINWDKFFWYGYMRFVIDTPKEWK